MGKNNRAAAKRRAKKNERNKKRRKDKLKRGKSHLHLPSGRLPRSHRRESLRAPVGFSDLMTRFEDWRTPMDAAVEIEGDRRVGDHWQVPDDLPTIDRLRKMADEDLRARLHQLIGIPVDLPAFAAAAEGQISAQAVVAALWGSTLDAAGASVETRARVAVCAAELWSRLIKRPSREQLALLRLDIMLPDDDGGPAPAASLRAALTFWRTLLQVASPAQYKLSQLETLIDGKDASLVEFGFDLAEDVQWLASRDPSSDLVAEAADVLLELAQRVEPELRWDWELDHALALALMGRHEEATAKAATLRAERPDEAKGHIICGEICRVPLSPDEKPTAAAFAAALAHFEAAAACEDGDDFDAQARADDLRADLARQTG